jgi:molecular chaperone IbpA
MIRKVNDLAFKGELDLFPTLLSEFDPFSKKFLPFESLLDTSNKYPKYNIFEDEQGYKIEVAVAGFTKDQLEVSIENDILSIDGKKKVEDVDNSKKYYYKGIAERSFSLKFRNSKDSEVKDVKLENGILTISFKTKKAEEKKKNILAIK